MAFIWAILGLGARWPKEPFNCIRPAKAADYPAAKCAAG
jgi:hypothetical protein